VPQWDFPSERGNAEKGDETMPKRSKQLTNGHCHEESQGIDVPDYPREIRDLDGWNVSIFLHDAAGERQEVRLMISRHEPGDGDSFLLDMWLTKNEVTYAVDHLSGKCREKGYKPPPLGDNAIFIASANRYPPEAWLQHVPPPFL
jgi:hypothetical protein